MISILQQQSLGQNRQYEILLFLPAILKLADCDDNDYSPYDDKKYDDRYDDSCRISLQNINKGLFS